MTDRRKKNQPDAEAGPDPERRMGDRRDSMRLPLQVSVTCGDDSFKTYPGDISIGGVFFESALPVASGDVVTLRVEFAQFNKQIEVKGEVVEVSPGGAGCRAGTRVKFVDLDLRSELLIARYLDESAQSC